MSRSLLYAGLSAAAIIGAMVVTIRLAEAAEDKSLTVVSWGGAYTKSQVEAYHKPFTAETGTAIVSADYNGGIAEVKAQVESGNVVWDKAIDGEATIADLTLLRSGVVVVAGTSDDPTTLETGAWLRAFDDSGAQIGETWVVWKWVAAPTSARSAPARALEATLCAACHASMSRRRRIEPSQAKLNWHSRSLRSAP